MAKFSTQFNYNDKKKNISRAFKILRMYFVPVQTQGIHFDIHCKGGVPL